jgi:uncharacterized protein YeaO (DUF488 family)
MAVALKRAYDPVSPDDGRRILVDRVWPRGRSKEALQIGAWLKDLAPSNDLRRWFGHDAARWTEFVQRYRAELKNPERAFELRGLANAARTEKLTLVYGARDQEHNQAVVLRDLIEQAVKSG